MLTTEDENYDFEQIHVWQITPKLAAFGLSKEQKAESETISDACGTEKYMAPEMAKARFGLIDLKDVRGHGRLDVFSAGLIAYYLFTGSSDISKKIDIFVEYLVIYFLT